MLITLLSNGSGKNYMHRYFLKVIGSRTNELRVLRLRDNGSLTELCCAKMKPGLRYALYS